MYEEPKSARLFDCPDGVGRFVQLTEWHWYSLDWMSKNHSMDLDSVVRVAWDIANEDMSEETIGEKFSVHLGRGIYYRLSHFFPWILLHDNENKMTKPDTKKIFGKIINRKSNEEIWSLDILYHDRGRICFKKNPSFFVFTTLTPWNLIAPAVNDNKFTAI